MTVARLLIDLATRALPADQHRWGAAMQAEFDCAADEGRGLSFAAGCCVATVRQRLAHRPTRAAMGRSGIALFGIVPLATFHLGSAWLGARFVATGHDRWHARLAAGDAGQRAIADAYRSWSPAILALLLVLALSHLVAAHHLIAGRAPAFVRALAAAVVAATILAGIAMWLVGTAHFPAILFAAILLEAAVLLFGWHRPVPSNTGCSQC